MSKMHVVQICPVFSPHIGGVQTHVQEISERLSKKGFEVDILTTDPSGKLPPEEFIDGIRVRRFKSWAPGDAYYFSRALKKFLDKDCQPCDVMHAHSYHAFPALYASSAKCERAFVFTPHYLGRGQTSLRQLLHIPYRHISRRIFSKAQRVICSSQYESKLVTERFDNAHKIVIIPNGIDPPQFARVNRDDRNEKVIMCAGRLEEYKGIQYLIMTLPKLRKDIHLLVIGEGSYKKRLIRLAIHEGVAERVTFLERLPKQELLRKYAEADMFALLSRDENYGISVGEALAAGTPCVVANRSALSEWVDGERCFGINYPIELDELKSLIEKVAGTPISPPPLPTWDEVVSKLILVYQSILDK